MKAWINKLNLWNRLGIVLTLIWLVIVPLVLSIQTNKEWLATIKASRELCMKAAESGPIEKFAEGYKICWDAWTTQLSLASPKYDQYLIAMLIVTIIAWLFAYAAVYVTKWVWAGRSTKSKSEISN